MDKSMIRSSQRSFTKGKSYLTNLITFYNEISGLVDKGRVWLYRSRYCLLWLQEGFWHCVPEEPHREAVEIWAGWANTEMNWKLSEQLSSEYCDQWYEIILSRSCFAVSYFYLLDHHVLSWKKTTEILQAIYVRSNFWSGTLASV